MGDSGLQRVSGGVRTKLGDQFLERAFLLIAKTQARGPGQRVIHGMLDPVPPPVRVTNLSRFLARVSPFAQESRSISSHPHPQGGDPREATEANRAPV